MTRRNWAFDVAVAAVVCALGVLEAVWGVDATHRQGPHAVEATVYVATGALLVVRRVSPLGCLVGIVVVSAVGFAAAGSPEGMGVALPALVAAYTVGRRVDPRRSWWGLVLVTALWVIWTAFDPLTTRSGLPLRLFWLSPWVIAWLIGALVRASRQAAEQRRLARQQRNERAVAEERNRIARELHDVIGHSVSVMTVQASAVRRRLSPDQVVERQALESVEAVGREALAEMRRMVGVLREGSDGSGKAPPPGLSQLPDLVDKFRTAGLPVSLSVSGEEVTLAPGLDLTAYRLIQEGLTNVLRHAVGPSRVEVSVAFQPGIVEICVADDGRGGSQTPDQDGHGLLGLRERVAVYGGELRAGERPGGGFELFAVLPVGSERESHRLTEAGSR